MTGRFDRSLQEGKRHGAEQQDRKPVENGFHWRRLPVLRNVDKADRRKSACLASLMLFACQPATSPGQVVAVVDGVDVTSRELRQETLSAHGQAAQEPLDRLVARKILAREATLRNLDEDGRFHFALRRARDELLVDALRRALDQASAEPTASEIDALLEAQPWRFAKRSVIVLALVDEDVAGPDEMVDTATLAERPDPSLLNAPIGTTVEFADRKWVVRNRRAVNVPASALREMAAAEIRRGRVDEEMRQVIREYRQSGRIVYHQRVTD